MHSQQNEELPGALKIPFLLAIKSEGGNYSLNGNHQIVLSNQDVAAGGAVFKYQKAKTDSSLSERLTAAGPLKEELTIQLLFQRAPHGSAVKYSFSTPLDEDLQYIYKVFKFKITIVIRQILARRVVSMLGNMR